MTTKAPESAMGDPMPLWMRQNGFILRNAAGDYDIYQDGAWTRLPGDQEHKPDVVELTYAAAGWIAHRTTKGDWRIARRVDPVDCAIAWLPSSLSAKKTHRIAGDLLVATGKVLARANPDTSPPINCGDLAAALEFDWTDDPTMDGRDVWRIEDSAGDVIIRVPASMPRDDVADFMAGLDQVLAARCMVASILDVENERGRQDSKWGGPDHDDAHSFADFVRWIGNYVGWSAQMADGLSWRKARRRMVQVAALAVAAVEWIDRRHPCARDASAHVMTPTAPEDW